MKKANEPDPHGRIWMHCEEGLNYSAASLSRFMLFILANNIELGSVYAFAGGKYPREQVCAAVLIHPDKITMFEVEVRAKLRKPPTLVLN